MNHELASATIDAQTASGITALYWASGNDNWEVVKMLLDARADPALAHRDGTTPMKLAKCLNKVYSAFLLAVSPQCSVSFCLTYVH